METDEEGNEQTYETDNNPLSLSDKGERTEVTEPREDDDDDGTKDTYEADNDALSLDDKGKKIEVTEERGSDESGTSDTYEADDDPLSLSAIRASAPRLPKPKAAHLKKPTKIQRSSKNPKSRTTLIPAMNRKIPKIQPTTIRTMRAAAAAAAAMPKTIAAIRMSEIPATATSNRM